MITGRVERAARACWSRRSPYVGSSAPDARAEPHAEALKGLSLAPRTAATAGHRGALDDGLEAGGDTADTSTAAVEKMLPIRPWDLLRAAASSSITASAVEVDGRRPPTGWAAARHRRRRRCRVLTGGAAVACAWAVQRDARGAHETAAAAAAHGAADASAAAADGSSLASTQWLENERVVKTPGYL